MADTPISPTDFAEAFKNFMVQVGKPATPPEAVFARHFRSHFEADPSKLPILAEEFRQFDHANVQIRKGLRFEVKNLEAIIKRTEGVSAAFIREMVRKAALAAADERD